MSDDERQGTSRKKRASAANEASDYAESDGSDFAAPPPKKRARASTTKSKATVAGSDAPTAEAKALLARISAAPTSFTLPAEEDPHHALRILATYTKSLESAVVAAAPVKKSPEQLEVAAEKLRKACRSQIKKQIKWKDSCKTGSAKWSYDGVAPDADTFKTLLGLTDPIKWKMKKIPLSDLQAALDDDLTVDARYDTMCITSDINVRWNAETGEFKLSGTYGAPRAPRA